MNHKPGQKLGRIAICIDNRLTREKKSALTRLVNAMRCFADVQQYASNPNEEQFIEFLQKDGPFHLVLLPWYRYLSWNKVEAFFGLTRSTGPTVAGYHSELLEYRDFGEYSEQMRCILLDFDSNPMQDILLTVQILLQEKLRSGIRPLLTLNTPIYTENWYASHGIGMRLESVLTLPEIKDSDWAHRSNSIRLILCSLWSLIYEEGPAKSDFGQPHSQKTPKACFQIGISPTNLAFRLCYFMPSWTPKTTLRFFWPNPQKPSDSAQILLKYSDWLRVHTFSDEHLIEVTTCLLPSQPSETRHEGMHTLWIDTLATTLVSEPPFELPRPEAPHLKSLHTPVLSAVKTQNKESDNDAKSRLLNEAANKIIELKHQLKEREELIRDLKSGGVGTAPPLPPPDIETLIESFQERYFEARFQIRQFEHEITRLETQGSSLHETETLRIKMKDLMRRELTWIQALENTIEEFRKRKNK